MSIDMNFNDPQPKRTGKLFKQQYHTLALSKNNNYKMKKMKT